MITKIQQTIDSKEGVLLYFSGENCSVCKALQPKIKEAFSTHFPKIEQVYINTNTHQKTAAHFSIFTVPSLLVFLGGKEFVRESRHISVQDVINKVERPYSIMTS